MRCQCSVIDRFRIAREDLTYGEAVQGTVFTSTWTAVFYCGDVGAGRGGAAAGPPPRPSSSRPSASVTETKIPPGSPVRIGFSVTLILSPGLSVLAFQPERTRYGGGFISIDQTVGAPFASATSRSIQECGFVQR